VLVGRFISWSFGYTSARGGLFFRAAEKTTKYERETG